MAIPFLACMVWVSTWNDLPPRVLPTIQAVEGGFVGAAHRNTDGSEDLGVMQVNTRWIGPLARYTGQGTDRVRARLLDDPCFNIAAAGAILRICIDEYPDDIMRAIGNYHSHTRQLNQVYQQQLMEHAIQLFGR